LEISTFSWGEGGLDDGAGGFTPFSIVDGVARPYNVITLNLFSGHF